MRTSMICQTVAVTSIVLSGLITAIRPAHSATTEVTLTGTVSCAHCQGIQPMHKLYTPYSWALNSVSLGDGILLVVDDKTYTLQGDKKQLLKFMSAKARVTGLLDGTTLKVETIGRVVKNKQRGAWEIGELSDAL